MTAAELIAELAKVPPETLVRVWADHGQASMGASTAGLQWIRREEADSWMADGTVHPEDLEDERAEGAELVQIFEVGAP